MATRRSLRSNPVQSLPRESETVPKVDVKAPVTVSDDVPPEARPVATPSVIRMQAFMSSTPKQIITKMENVSVTPAESMKSQPAPNTMPNSKQLEQNQAERQRALEGLPSLFTDLEMSDKDLLGVATKIMNVVYQSYGKTETKLPDDLLERLITSSLVLERKQQENVIYLLARALSSVQVSSEHLPVDSMAFNMLQLILRSLFGSGAQDFHESTAGEKLAQWLGESCSMVVSTEEFLEHFSTMVFPWGMHRYSCQKDKEEEKISLQVDAHYVDVQTEVNDGLTKPRMGLIMTQKEQEIAKLLRRNSDPSDAVQYESFDADGLSNLRVIKPEEFSDEDLGGFVEDELTNMSGDIEAGTADMQSMEMSKNMVKNSIPTDDIKSEKNSRAAEEEDYEEGLDENDEEYQPKTPKKRKLSGATKAKQDWVYGSGVKRYPCSVCGKKFTLKKLRDEHTIAEHGATEDGTYQCHVCELSTLESQEELEEHMDIHRRTCKICDFIVPKGLKMKGHLSFHRDKGSCQFCKEEFATRWDARMHVYESHGDIRPFACDDCRIRFAAKESYDEHVAVVHKKEENRHECEICHERFPFSATLVKHKRKEHARVPEKKHQCNICGKLFRAALKVKYHKKIVHKLDLDLSVACVYCEEKFPNRRQLQLHKNKEHPGEDSIVYCPVCTATFTTQKDMMHHFVGAHENEDTTGSEAATATGGNFPCYVCDKVFESEQARASHAKIIHNETKVYQCDICAAVMRSKPGFDNHMNMHLAPKQVLCEVCGKAFDSKRNCERHKFMLHRMTLDERRREKRWPCQFCGRKFTERVVLVVHEQREHLGNKNYGRQKCHLCPLTFTCVGSLKRHAETVHGGKERSPYLRKTCSVCDKELAANSLKEHMQQAHGVGRTPYQCTHCKRYYSSLENLKQHCEKPQLCTKKLRAAAAGRSRLSNQISVVQHHPEEEAMVTAEEVEGQEEVQFPPTIEIVEQQEVNDATQVIHESIGGYTFVGSDAITLDQQEVQYVLDPNTQEYYVVQ